MKKMYSALVFSLLSLFCPAQTPGSGNALSFDGVDDIVTVPHNSSIAASNSFTVEAWVNISNIPADENFHQIFGKYRAGNGYMLYAFRQEGSSFVTFRFRVANSPMQQFENFYSRNITTEDFRNKWMHFAVTFDGALVKMYINGLYIDGRPAAFTLNDNINAPFEIGNNNYFATTKYPLLGMVDEVRIWNRVMNNFDIKERLCSKITSTDPYYSNLKAYYRFDEATGNIATDLTANGNNGTIDNGATRITSGAPLGDISSYSYNGTHTTTQLTNNLRGDKFRASMTSGSSFGVHVYCVQSSPNTLVGTTRVGGNNAYFGVFVPHLYVDVPQYTAEYNYAGIPGVGGLMSQSNLRLYKRTNNADVLWTDAGATLNTSNTTLTCTGQNTEYIVGTEGTILPTDLLTFSATKNGNTANLSWATSAEQNSNQFVVQRSSDGTHFTNIATVAAAGNCNTQKRYNYIDDLTGLTNYSVIYYRLQLRDINGESKYSLIATLKNILGKGITMLQQNPVQNQARLNYTSTLSEKLSITIMDMLGRKMTYQALQVEPGSNKIVLNTTQLSKGLYLVQIVNSQEKVGLKMIKE
ncbi:MAG: LamG-like jellyroll fold domain-containing protein [Chitinophagaceae bacterium]